jgi:hypothetical protein
VCQECAKDTAGLLRARRLNGVAQPKNFDIGRSILPSPIYHTGPAETVETLRAVAPAGPAGNDLFQPGRLPGNATPEIVKEVAADRRFVAIEESSEDIRRTTEIINRLGERYAVLTGVDNLALEGPRGRRLREGRWPRLCLPGRDGRELPPDAGGASQVGAGGLPLVPAAPRPRCLDLPSPEHQACRSSRDPVDRVRAGPAQASVRRGGNRWRRSCTRRSRGVLPCPRRRDIRGRDAVTASPRRLARAVNLRFFD